MVLENAICIGKQGGVWNAYAGISPDAPAIRSAYELIDLVTWLRDRYPYEHLVIVGRTRPIEGTTP